MPKQLSDGDTEGWVMGQSATDKGAFFGATPVVQQSAITSGGDTTTEFTAAIDAIIVALRNLGLIADGDA